MATIKSVFEMEDRISATLNRASNAMADATRRCEMSEQAFNAWQDRVSRSEITLDEMAMRLAAAQEAQERLNAAMSNPRASSYEQFEAQTNSALMTADAFARLEAQYNRMSERQVANELSLQRAEATHINAAQSVSNLTERFNILSESERIAAEMAQVTAAAQQSVAESAMRSADQTEAAFSRGEPIVDRSRLALQRYENQIAIVEQRIGMYQSKMDSLTQAMRVNEQILEQLNALQAQTYSAARQSEIDAYMAKQSQLSQQYNQLGIQMQSAQNQMMTAQSRMTQAAAKLNPVISGLTTGISSMGGAAARFGMIGVQALSGITAGMSAATVASNALNASIGMGLGLVISALVTGIGAIIAAENEAEKAAKDAEKAQKQLDEAAKRYQKTAAALTGTIRGLATEYSNMKSPARDVMESYLKTKDSIESNVGAMEVNAFRLQKNMEEAVRLTEKTDLLVEEQDRLKTVFATMNGLIPGLIDLMATETGEINFQKDRVWELVNAYGALAKAKAMAAASEDLMKESFTEKLKTDRSIDKLETWKAGLPEMRDKIVAALPERIQSNVRSASSLMPDLRDPEMYSAVNALIKDVNEKYGLSIEEVQAYSASDIINEALKVANDTIAGHKKNVEAFKEEAEFYNTALTDAMEQVFKAEGIFYQNKIQPPDGSFNEKAANDAAARMWQWPNYDSKGNLKTHVDNDIKFSDEDLQMLFDVSRRQYHINYQQVVPQVTITVNEAGGPIDYNKITEALTESIIEAAENNLSVGSRRW